ncbi:hypothetical protein Q670_10845 [Alcanivorax sp. P2S70]|uniref:hypothetical protein n=1 Tax=Alcanivorax TaxID=59753 RepID=UPI0003B73D42|nr:hypothetical protein [Alcanivorax sp. P2S70]ERP92107.1 hypothetical protein Q670_10845 [Alcanivorax sp. P2S70]
MTSQTVPAPTQRTIFTPVYPLIALILSGSGILLVTDIRLQLLGMALFYSGLLLATSCSLKHLLTRQLPPMPLTAMLVLLFSAAALSPALPESIQDLLVVLLP